MKRILIAMAATLLAVAVVGSVAYAGGAAGDKGNLAPSGPHYNLNIIGVENPKNYSNTDPFADANGGKRIFVTLNNQQGTSTKILLREGPFDVLDYNGTDGTASFQLPNPDEDGDGVTSYSVFVRALGKPGGKATLQSCYTDATGTWCAVDFEGGVAPIELKRTTGKGSTQFQNVSKDLLYVDYCALWGAGTDGVMGTADDVCADVNQIALFSNDEIDYLWDYANQGLRLAQLRFYEGFATTTPWGSAQ